MSERDSFSLSVIDGVDLQEVNRTMDKITQFQIIVQKNLKQDYDYGVIPGTSKPSLLKPGAEKIFMLLGLRSEFDVIDFTRDFEKGFFQYAVKCKLYKGNILITEGVGAANNREKKWVKQDPYSIDNTVLKMARKRSMTDAALTVGSLSDIFTQDLDELDLSSDKASVDHKYATDQDGTISKAQAKRMFAIAKGNADLIASILKDYGYRNSEEVLKTKYEEICKKIEENADKQQQQTSGITRPLLKVQAQKIKELYNNLGLEKEEMITIMEEVCGRHLDSVTKLYIEEAENVIKVLEGREEPLQHESVDAIDAEEITDEQGQG